MYGRIFDSLWSGSLCGKPFDQLVLIRLICASDQDGVVDLHPNRIAADTGIPIDDVRAAIKRLEEPDPDSRSPEMGGRRLSRLDDHRDWGWVVVNKPKYAALVKAHHVREQTKARKERWKASHKGDSNGHGTDEERTGNAEGTESAPITDSSSQLSVLSSKATTPGKPGAAVKARRQVDGPEGEVLRAFDKGHREALDLPYMAAFSRDIQTLKNPLKVYGLPLMLEFVEAFWSETRKSRQNPDDPTYAAGKAKPTIPGLIGQIPNLMRRYRFDNRPPEKAHA